MSLFGRTLRALWLSAIASVFAGCASPFANETAELSEQDSSIEVRIKGALIEEMGMAGTAIDVEFAEGTATLRGFVEDEAERQKAATLARQQDGVSSVTNEIAIK